jgi:fructoselysine-6-P-deglycase FrlB-like protein
MGSSRFAALAAASFLRARGLDAAVERASTGSPWPPSRETLVVAVSSSGSTPETVETALRHRGASTVVAVTNRPDSELAQVADGVLPLLAGKEAGGVACKSYQCALAVLLLLAGRLTGSGIELATAVAAAETIRDTRADWSDRALELLGGGPVFAIAPDERISSAEQSALMLREGPRIPADACETGDWLHVDVYLSKHPGYRAVLFPGSRFDEGVTAWLAKRGGAAVAVGRDVEGAALTVPYPGADDPLVATLVETSAVELLAAELWRRSSL